MLNLDSPCGKKTMMSPETSNQLIASLFFATETYLRIPPPSASFTLRLTALSTLIQQISTRRVFLRAFLCDVMPSGHLKNRIHCMQPTTLPCTDGAERLGEAI